jgi:hypothetical protein
VFYVRHVKSWGHYACLSAARQDGGTVDVSVHYARFRKFFEIFLSLILQGFARILGGQNRVY